MYRSVNSLLRPLASARALPARQIHAGAAIAQKKEMGGYPPSLTQGHTTSKASDPMHGAADIQSEAVTDARKTKAKAGTGQDPGFDTAKESGLNGNAEAQPSEGTGPFKDHRGDQQRVGKHGEMGGTEETAGGSTGDSILKAIGLGGKKTPAEKKGKGFHTSARSYMPEDDKLAGARKPKEQKLEGEQNQHLKHKSDTSAPDSGKGNAGPNPTLPSKSGGSATGQKRSFASSARARANEDDPLKQDVNKDEPNSLGMKPTEEGHNQDGKAQDKAAKGNNKPGLPQGEKEKAAKGMTRGLHTSARASFASSGRAMANEDDPLKQDVNKDEPLSSTMKPTEEGHNQAGTGKTEDKDAKGNTKPGLPQGEKEKAAKGMTRGLHTSARAFAQRTDPGYVAAVEGEPNSSKNAPPTGLPQELGAAYKDSAYKPASKAAEPSSKVDFSSTATAKPNEALKQAAKDGTLADRNEQPDTPKYGKIGLDDGWKERKHQ